MTDTRAPFTQPSWMSDARMRRAMSDQIRRRRAKRRRELAEFERAIADVEVNRGVDVKEGP